MTDKELRKLKRAELLEILFYLRKENDSLKQENTELKQRLENGGELPEGVLKQIEKTVNKAVSNYFNPQSENEDTDDNSGSKEKMDSEDQEAEETEKNGEQK